MSKKEIAMSNESSAKLAPEFPVNAEAMVSYLTQVGAQHEKLSAAFKVTYERSQRMSTQIIETLIAGQHDLIELTKKVVQKPQDYSNTMKAVVDASTAAQERILDLAKTFYREQADVTSELRKGFKTACESTAFGDAGRNMMNFWIKPR